MADAELVNLPKGQALFAPGAERVPWIVAEGQLSRGSESAISGDLVDPREDASDEREAIDWSAEEVSGVLLLQPSAYDRLLGEDPSAREYFRRSRLESLRGLKIDLVLSGLPQSLLSPTLNALVEMTFEEFQNVWGDSTGLLVVQEGGIEATSHRGGDTLGVVWRGDYFFCRRTRASIQWIARPETRVWWLGSGHWARACRTNHVHGIFPVLDPLKKKIEAGLHKLKAVSPRHASEVSEDDGDDEDLDRFFANGEDYGWKPPRRSAVVIQNDEMDCAAACLASICAYHGRRIGIQKLRELLRVSRDGTSLESLLEGALTVGFDAVPLELDASDLGNLKLPCIALVGYHYMVLYDFGQRGALVMDPSVGILRKSSEEFLRDWSGYALALRPTESLFRYPESGTDYAKYLALLKHHWGSVGELFLASSLGLALSLAVPLGMRTLLDDIVPKGNPPELRVAVLVVLGIVAVSGVFGLIHQYLMDHLRARLETKFSALFITHVFKLPLSFFSLRKVGDITSRMVDLIWIRDAFTGHANEIILGGMAMLAYLVLLAAFSWQVALMACLILGGLALFIVWIFRKLSVVRKELMSATALTKSILFEQFRSLETLKSLNAQVQARWRWEFARLRMLQAERKSRFLLCGVLGASELARNALIIGALSLGAVLLLDGKLSPGQLVAINAIIVGLTTPLLMVIDRLGDWNQVVVSFGRVDDVFVALPEQRCAKERPVEFAFANEIRFEDVYHSYGDPSEDVLNGVSFSVRAGDTVAFVGSSGSGKSTLAYLISRLYRPREGRILIDGVESGDFALEELRRNVGMVIQENSLFSGSILENIASGSPHPDLERAIRAAILADAHEFISRLPQGYLSQLGEGGMGLSGGQKQKINIARALYNDPPILILDEATSALDAISEESIIRNLRNIGRKRTLIFIAHRLNTIRHADRILVLEKGKIVESGSHDELLGRGGVYSQLLRDQLS